MNANLKPFATRLRERCVEVGIESMWDPEDPPYVIGFVKGDGGYEMTTEEFADYLGFDLPLRPYEWERFERAVPFLIASWPRVEDSRGTG